MEIKEPKFREGQKVIYVEDGSIYTVESINSYSFKQNELFISDLEARMPKQLLKNKAKIKNPKDEVWYVKSLFFAYLLLGDYGLFSKTLYNATADKYSKTKLLKLVEHADTKIKDRQEAEEKERKKKSRENHNKERFTDKGKNIKNAINTKGITKTKSVTSTGVQLVSLHKVKYLPPQ